MPRSKGIFPDYHVISQCQENIFNKANMTLSNYPESLHLNRMEGNIDGKGN